LVSQVRRSASSIPANIAEGFGRRSTKDFLRHLDIACGSLEETRYLLLPGSDLGLLKPESNSELQRACNEVGRLLGGLMHALRRRLNWGFAAHGTLVAGNWPLKMSEGGK